MPIVPEFSTLARRDNAFLLCQYAQYVGYPERNFWGFTGEQESTLECGGKIWTKHQRDDIARHLQAAEEMIENELGYFLRPKYTVGLLSNQAHSYVRQVDQTWPDAVVHTRWGHVISPGVEASATIQAGLAVTPLNELITINITLSSVVPTSVDEVRIFYPGTDVEIIPSSITIDGTDLTIVIPQYRAMKSTLVDNSAAGIDMTDATTQETVDVKRIYTDDSTNAVFAAPGSTTGTERTQTAHMRVIDDYMGTLRVQPATYSGGTWSKCSLSFEPDVLRLNYYSGVKNMERSAVEMVVRLAHVLMHHTPCNCDKLKERWIEDRDKPAYIDPIRGSCPWGTENGAWAAWNWAKSTKIERLGSVYA